DALTLEDAVGARDGQRYSRNMCNGFADNVLCAEEGRRGLRRWTLGVVKPRRSVGDKTGSLELGAQLCNLPADIGMIGERLGVARDLAGADNTHQLAECGAGHSKIDGSVGAPSPAARRPPECPDIIRLVDDSIFCEPTIVEDQRIAARRAHP